MFRGAAVVFLACGLSLVAARSVEQSQLRLEGDAELVNPREIDVVDVPADETPAVDAGNNKPAVENGGDGRQFTVFPRVRVFRMPPLFRSSIFGPNNFFGPQSPSSTPNLRRRPSIFSSAEDGEDPFSLHDLFRPDFGFPVRGGGSDGDQKKEEDGTKRVGGGDEEVASKPETDGGDQVSFTTSFNDRRPTFNRRPGFTSLSDMFGDFNRRMQSFESDIANLFSTFARPRPRPRPSVVDERVPAVVDDAETLPLPDSSVAGAEQGGEQQPQDGGEEEDTGLFSGRPGGFGFHFLRPFRPLFHGFRNPAEFPETYKNSTSKTEVINGTKVMVNETISKGGDENSSHFFHVKVIHMLPEGGEEEAGEGQEKIDAVFPDRDVEQMTEKQPDVPAATNDDGKVSPAVVEDDKSASHVDSGLLSHILPEQEKDQQAAEIVKDGLNPAAFGYSDKDNEIGENMHDVQVVNLPSSSSAGDNKANLPTGATADAPKIV